MSNSKPELEPIGISDFKILRTQLTDEGKAMSYCDKTMLLRDIINEGTQVLLFTRPRRFGKTLNLSMLKYFFGTQEPLFEGLKITKYLNIMENHRNYPVISMSFKSMDCTTFEKCKTEFKKIIAKAYNEFLYLQTSSVLTAWEKELFNRCLRDDMADDDIGHALEYLVKALYKHHSNTYVIVLIDEYDAPLQSAYLHDYLDEALRIIRPFLREGLKDSAMLLKGIITGVSRVAKENIFSGLNNFAAFGITQNPYVEYFGFTENEVQAMIDPQHLKEVKAWYNGYVFGSNTVMYNPWCVPQRQSFDSYESKRQHKLSRRWRSALRHRLTGADVKPVQAAVIKCDGRERWKQKSELSGRCGSERRRKMNHC